ncbi:hypothetical protein M432DRAFT_182884 [Thermoascus aurantiacus ATCC 26904]
MDAQYPFASREDIWRVLEEVKDLQATQIEHGERIARLERRRDDDARLKSVWGPLSPFPGTLSGAIPTEPSYTPTVDAFKGFDQGQQHGLVNTMGLDGEEEPRRGASRANSVRFDESAIHGYYGQANRSSTDLPLRTGSGMGSHPLTERSLSHRSDGRQSSSGHSHHSARTNSLGLDTSRLIGSVGGSPLNVTMPPPGLFILGPVPCIIRCWLTTSFSNDSLLYAAVCSGSYASFIGYPMVEKLGLEDRILQEEGVRYLKLPLYLPEASLHQTSSRAGSPTPQLPALTIRFLVRDTDPDDKSIQIFLGSDVLRSHNADILFSQDKIIMVDDERNKISIPIVRPENDAAFKFLSTASDLSRPVYTAGRNGQPQANGHADVGVIGPPAGLRSQGTSSTPATVGPAGQCHDDDRKNRSAHPGPEEASLQQTQTKSTTGGVSSPSIQAKTEPTGVWGSWRRDPKPDSGAVGMSKSTRGRAMKVLRPSKSSSRAVSRSASQNASSSAAETTASVPANAAAVRRPSQPSSSAASPEILHPTPSRSTSGGYWGKPRSENPVGGASAFGWLNSSQQSKRTATNPE